MQSPKPRYFSPDRGMVSIKPSLEPAVSGKRVRRCSPAGFRSIPQTAVYHHPARARISAVSRPSNRGTAECKVSAVPGHFPPAMAPEAVGDASDYLGSARSGSRLVIR